MKIAVISDTHDNLPNIEKAINYINQQGIDVLFHCGDISTKETMQFISEKFKGKIFAVFGNMDIYNKGESWGFKNVKIFPEAGEAEIDGQKISFCHYPETAKNLAETQKYDFVFYGHTHKPWEEKIGNCLLLNPGNIAGMFYKATFAILDIESKKAKLEILQQLM